MEAVKKHWPKITVGVVAVALGAYLVLRNRQSKVAVVADISEQQAILDGKVWPKPRRIIDATAD